MLTFSKKRKRIYANAFFISYSCIRGQRFLLKLLEISNTPKKRLHQLSKICPSVTASLKSNFQAGYELWSHIREKPEERIQLKRKVFSFVFFFFFFNVRLDYNIKY